MSDLTVVKSTPEPIGPKILEIRTICKSVTATDTTLGIAAKALHKATVENVANLLATVVDELELAHKAVVDMGAVNAFYENFHNDGPLYSQQELESILYIDSIAKNLTDYIERLRSRMST